MKTRKISIYEEFCQEMDLFSESQLFPDWIFDYREHHLSKISAKLIKFCRKLKFTNVNFKILYPVNIFGKWKFADVYIPKCKTVVMVTTYPHPAGWLTLKASFFAKRFNVIELDGYESQDSLNKLIDRLR